MNLIPFKLRRLLLACCAFALISGCAMVRIHRIDIQQGNLVTQKMIDKLKPGMTKEQVIYVMGHPLAENSFDQSRWDYVHTLSIERKKPERRVVSLYFEDELLTRFEGFLKPSDSTTPTPEEPATNAEDSSRET